MIKVNLFLLFFLFLILCCYENSHAQVAKLIEINNTGGATCYGCDVNDYSYHWQAPHAIWDTLSTVDNPDEWEAHQNLGATWNNDYPNYGILVLDMKQVRTMNKFSVFQMFSDGKTTGVKLYKNTDFLGSTQPTSASSGWVEVTSGIYSIGAGSFTDLGSGQYIVTSPTYINVADFSSRYIKIEAFNDGSLGDGGYIELHGIKGFYYNGSSYSINYLRGGAGGQSSALPVNFGYFKGEWINSQNTLNWSTHFEVNNKYFIIEKSVNEVDWECVDTVFGSGNSNNLLTYSYIDNKSKADIMYYRLKQVDFDNTFEYSKIISINRSQVDVSNIEIFPNPSSGSFNIEYYTDKDETISVKLISTIGQVSYFNNFSITQGKNIISILAESVSKGIYLVELSNELGMKFSTKVIIE